MSDSPEFETVFAKRAGQVRRALATRDALGGFATGVGVGIPAALLGWWLRVEPALAIGLGCGLAGAALGLLRARRRRWSDEAIALYLDGRAEGRELITTALELHRGGKRAAALTAEAANLLKSTAVQQLTPSRWHRWHTVSLPLLLIGVACTAWLPKRPVPSTPQAATGSDLVRKALPELETLTALSNLPASTPEQRARLDDIARRARQLRADLERGVPKREALARLAELRDDIVSERLALGNARNRAGLEAALGALEQLRASQAAAKALGNGDLVRFDSEMQRLANQAETAAREAARSALEEARRRAAAKGAQDVAGALSEAERAFAERAAESEALRKLADAMGDSLGAQGQAAREELDGTGSPQARRKLAESMLDALEELDENELRTLAERLREAQGEPSTGSATAEELERLAEELTSPEGKRTLRDSLRELGQSSASDGATRSEGLGRAELGVNGSQGQLGSQAPGASGSQAGKSPAGMPGPGATPRAEAAHTAGSGRAVEGQGLRAKAPARLNPRLPLRAAVAGRAQARPGRFAAEVPVEALPAAGADEVEGVQRSDIPEEYRQQVGRYFSPE